MRLVGVLSALFINHVYSWSEESHQAIAFIAGNYLSNVEKAAVQEILGLHIDPTTLQQDLADVSNYADATAQNWSKNFHVAHIERADTGGYFVQCGQYNSDKCLMSGMGNWTVRASSARNSQEMREESMKFVIHIVGDMFQPLHVGRFSDRGGRNMSNVTKSYITYGGRYPTLNLHELWDKGLFYYDELQRAGADDMRRTEVQFHWTVFTRGDWEATANFLIDLIDDSANDPLRACLADVPGSLDVSNRTAVRAYALKLVKDTARQTLRYPYKETDGTDVESNKWVSEAYMQTRSLVMRSQLMKAGVNLACFLRQIVAGYLADKQRMTTTTAAPVTTAPATTAPKVAKKKDKPDSDVDGVAAQLRSATLTRTVSSRRSKTLDSDHSEATDASTVSDFSLPDFSETSSVSIGSTAESTKTRKVKSAVQADAEALVSALGGKSGKSASDDRKLRKKSPEPTTPQPAVEEKKSKKKSVPVEAPTSEPVEDVRKSKKKSQVEEAAAAPAEEVKKSKKKSQVEETTPVPVEEPKKSKKKAVTVDEPAPVEPAEEKKSKRVSKSDLPPPPPVVEEAKPKKKTTVVTPTTASPSAAEAKKSKTKSKSSDDDASVATTSAKNKTRKANRKSSDSDEEN